jgi:8-oxo-dGTP diphosphatase
MTAFKGFRIAARGLVQEQDKILFVSDDGEFWYLPGGQLEYNESLSDCVKREIYEETGLQVKVGSLLNVFEFLDTKDNIHKIHFIFNTEILEGKLSEEWNDDGGLVQYRRFFGLEEIKQNKKIIPRFLANESFGHQSTKINDVYQGAVRVCGFSVPESITSETENLLS